MFYVKHESDEVLVKVEINDENVFTVCPNCGTEHQVDLCDVFKDGDIDLFGAQVFCAKCSKQYIKQ